MNDTTPLPKISLSELSRRLQDDDVPLEDIEPYIIQVPSPDGSFGPAFQPNPSLVTGLETGLEGGIAMGWIIDLLNARQRRKRQRAYRARIDGGWTGLKIVEEGDSWFQYPARHNKIRDIIDHLMVDHAVFSLSGAGHTLAQMIRQDEALDAVETVGAQAFLMSAGGNDLFDNGQIGKLLEDIHPGSPPEELVGRKFLEFVDDILLDYGRFLLKVRREFPGLAMFFHGYANAHSRGDQWIGQPLESRGITSREKQNRIVEVMVSRFNARQKAMASDPAFGGKLFHVDLSDLGPEGGDWFDEIHMGTQANQRAAKRFADAVARHAQPPARPGGLEGGLEAPQAVERAVPAPDPILEAITAHALELAHLDEDALVAELQLRLNRIERDPGAAALPSSDLLLLAGGLEGGGLPVVGPIAKRLLRRWERELYDLICGDDEEDKAERQKLLDALGVSREALVGALAAWLATGPLGVSALLAGVLAAILINRFGGAAADELCQIWKERLADDD